MKKTLLASACALVLTSTFALAQTSQQQGGGSTAPTSNPTPANQGQTGMAPGGNMSSGSGMSGDKMGMSGDKMMKTSKKKKKMKKGDM